MQVSRKTVIAIVITLLGATSAGNIGLNRFFSPQAFAEDKMSEVVITQQDVLKTLEVLKSEQSRQEKKLDLLQGQSKDNFGKLNMLIGKIDTLLSQGY